MLPETEPNTNLIPVSLDEAESKIRWMDVGSFHFYQGFFSEGLEVLSALRRRQPEIHISDLEELPAETQCHDCLAPSAFIFHAGRCGSTLLSKVLARSRDHLVFGEAAPHNQIWNLLPAESQAAISLYRRLVLTMGRRRLASYRAHIIKFTSFNILEARFVRNAFPNVPTLFIFRRPGAILASYHRASPGWLGSNHKLVRSLVTPESALEAFFKAALSVAAEDFRCLDYDDLTPESLPGILRYFRLSPPESDRASMLNEFAWDSKSGAAPRRFDPNLPGSAIDVPPVLEDLYLQLKARSFS